MAKHLTEVRADRNLAEYRLQFADSEKPLLPSQYELDKAAQRLSRRWRDHRGSSF